jgi:hypothetical protein
MIENVQAKLAEYRQMPGLAVVEGTDAVKAGIANATTPATTTAGKIVAGVDVVVHAAATATQLPVLNFASDFACGAYGLAKLGAAVALDVGGVKDFAADLKGSAHRTLLAAGASAAASLARIIPVLGDLAATAGSMAAHGTATYYSAKATGLTQRDVQKAAETAGPYAEKATELGGKAVDAATPFAQGALRRISDAAGKRKAG